MSQRGGTGLILAVMLIAAACSSSSTASSTSAGSSTTATPPTTITLPGTTTSNSPSTTTSPTTPPRTIDLSDRPLIWFGPLPPLPTDAGRPFTGAEDFFALFEPDAEWDTASEHVDVFLLYAEWVGGHATVAQLERIVRDLDRRGIAVAVEGSPLALPDDCGAGIESWGGIPEGRRVADKFVAAGGVIDMWAMDAPLAYAHVGTWEGACQWEPARVAAEIADFRGVMEGYFPDIVVGDTEGLLRELPLNLYSDWLATFEEVTGEPLPFFHLDVDWGRTDWPLAAAEVGARHQHRGVRPLRVVAQLQQRTDVVQPQLDAEVLQAVQPG